MEISPEPTKLYDRLARNLALVDKHVIDLSTRNSGLGFVQLFSGDIIDYLKSLMEVNRQVREQEHIALGMFYHANMQSVALDSFLFVHNGYYIDNPNNTLQLVLEQMRVYHELMHHADQAQYGPMEHNHRQLYSYTESMIVLLDQLLNHFG